MKHRSCKDFFFFYLELLLERWHISSPWHLQLIFNTGAWLQHNKAGKWAIEYVNVEIVIQQNSSLCNNDWREAGWGKGTSAKQRGLTLCARMRHTVYLKVTKESLVFDLLLLEPDMLIVSKYPTILSKSVSNVNLSVWRKNKKTQKWKCKVGRWPQLWIKSLFELFMENLTQHGIWSFLAL